MIGAQTPLGQEFLYVAIREREYQLTARRITSGSNWRHLNRPAAEGARIIAAQLIRPLLQSCNTSSSNRTIAGSSNEKIKKGQFNLATLPGKPATAPETWVAVLAT